MDLEFKLDRRSIVLCGRVAANTRSTTPKENSQVHITQTIIPQKRLVKQKQFILICFATLSSVFNSIRIETRI